MSQQKIPAVHVVIHCFDNGHMIETHIPFPDGRIGPLPSTQKVHQKREELIADLNQRLDDNEQVRAAMRLEGGHGFEIVSPGQVPGKNN
jgi:hypothetical protein